jgi:hypothetical protein
MGSTREDSGSISIFTDSNARVPKYDPTSDNPFVESSASRKKTTKKKVNKLGEEGNREDGMVYLLYEPLYNNISRNLY